MNSFIQGRITGTEKRAPVLVDSTGRLLTSPTGGSDTPATLTSQLIPASTSVNIPAGSRFAVAFLTGTGTFNGAAVLAGFTRSGATAAIIVVTTNAASTAYLDIAA